MEHRVSIHLPTMTVKGLVAACADKHGILFFPCTLGDMVHRAASGTAHTHGDEAGCRGFSCKHVSADFSPFFKCGSCNVLGYKG